MKARPIYLVSGLELWQWREEARTKAQMSDVPLAEVDWLLQEVTSLDRLALRLESFKNQFQIELQMSLSMLTQRWHQRVHDRLPVQYLVGVTPWRHFSLAVSPAVLIPRPETECLIDLALAAVQNSSVSDQAEDTLLLQQGHWADLGTGSGAIALGLADAFPDAKIHAVDCSWAALAIAQKNALNLGKASRIQFKQGSWWQPLDALKGQLSGMVANPPYIPTNMVSSLQPEVANHEPHLALDGGADGLYHIRHLVETAPVYLRPGGIWLIEMMAGQADAVAHMLRNQGSYCQIQIHADLAGIERFALAYKKPSSALKWLKFHSKLS